SQRMNESLDERPSKVAILERRRLAQDLLGAVDEAIEERALPVVEVGEPDDAHELVRRTRRLELRITAAVHAPMMLEGSGHPKRGRAGTEQGARAREAVIAKERTPMFLDERFGKPAEIVGQEQVPDIVKKRCGHQINARRLG